MEVVIHGHQTEVTDVLKARATDGVRKLNEHFQRLISADVRFEEDGVFKSVEVVVHAPRNTQLVARAESKYHETALNDAIAKLDAQIRKLKVSQKRQVHDTDLRA